MTITTNSTADRAKAIRATLKLRGWNARAVSVRCDYYSMGSSIYVTVRQFGISAQAVKDAVEGFARIDRCQMTGEILSGGNTFVHVDYATKVQEAARNELRETVDAAHAVITTTAGASVEVVPGMAVVFTNEIDAQELRLDTPGNEDTPARSIWNSPDALLDCVVRHVLAQGWAPKAK